jgi:putative ABC transport system ATP-binding protein
MSSADIVSCTDLVRRYGEGEAAVNALAGVTVSFATGEYAAIMGPSGSGKSTLMHCLAGLDRPTSGSVVVDGTEIAKLDDKALTALRRDKIGFIFQSFNLIPVLSAQENVELALELANKAGDHQAAARKALAQVGLAGLENRRPNQLSGGQQQRVAIARALVKEPLIVIADEPTANLDSANGEQVLSIMQQLNAELGTTFLISSHDPRVIAHARRVLTLRDGLLVSDEQRPQMEKVS